MEGFLYAGAAFGLALGASILRVGREIERWLTGLFIISGALAAASITLQHQSSGTDRGGMLELLEIGTAFASGPILYLFCIRRTGATRTRRLPVAVHFVPAAVVSMLIVLEGRYPLPMSLMVAHQIAYTVASIRRTWPVRRDPGLTWPVQLCAIAVAIHVAQLVRLSFPEVVALRDVVPIAIVGGLAVLAFLALRRALDASLLGPPRPRYERSGLRDDAAVELEERLSRLMAEEKPWLDPDLSLERLAAQLGSTSHHLSELFSTRMSTTFNELVARYRLEEARKRLADPSNDWLTIEAIATGSGFSSRSTFYAAFRRSFGETPTRFRAGARG